MKFREIERKDDVERPRSISFKRILEDTNPTQVDLVGPIGGLKFYVLVVR